MSGKREATSSCRHRLLSSISASGSGVGARLATRDRTGEAFGVFTAAIDRWQPTKSRRWAHTLLRHASRIRTMASTWALAPSFTMELSHITGAGVRWKKFLSQASLTDIRSGCDPQGRMPCGVKRSFGVRARGLEKTAIAY